MTYYLKRTITNSKNSIIKNYNIPINKKVILYAPTWRDDEFYGNGIYKFYSQIDFDLFEKRTI